jgi:Restriction endonuclease S subunits
MGEWINKRLGDIVCFNPKETLKKGTVAKKIAMENLRPFNRDIYKYEITEYTGGTKFKNGDTIMARITPCLENGKIAKVGILSDEEIGFGSTEYIVFRAINGITDEDFVYYLVCSPVVREPAIKSMVGSSGRQRVQTDVLQNLEVLIPDLDTQQKIGALLKSIDDKIEEINNKA